MKYVKVAIIQKGNSIDSLFTYGCEDDKVKVGDKVFVPFGMGNRQKEAFVFEVSGSPENSSYKLKNVSRVLPELSLPKELISTCSWAKDKYLCSYTEALSCCTPPDIKKQRDRKPHKDLKPEIPQIDTLTDEQAAALSEIENAINAGESETFLLHGVTGSGKTEVYLRTIEMVANQGKTALVLVPEISLTIQTIRRFKGRFGADRVAILHSKLSAGERFDEWMRIRSGEVKIVVGVRSVIFAPVENIGAIIIDEEHEGTYKSEQAPKYDAIEVAERRAGENNAVLVLGSATPSVCTYQKGLEGIYKILTLKERYNKNPMPLACVVDMREELKNGNKSMISVLLYTQIKSCMEEGLGVILFLNKRGYSSFVSCRSCGFVMKCKDCGISQTYHKSADRVICHLCGRSEQVPHLCPECGSKYIKHFGTGTERLEEAVKELFPEAVVGRLDLDTTKTKGSLETILADFGKGKTQILIGTQIVAKGLDFKHVGLVGVVAADLSLYIPDYRASERTYQLITQAAGRAGRGDSRGKVIVQSYGPESYAIQCALASDYVGLFKEEIGIRKQAGYPPFTDIILITTSVTDEKKSVEAIDRTLRILIENFGREFSNMVLGPKPAHVYKMRERFRNQMIIKCRPEDTGRYLEVLAQIKKMFYGPEYTDHQFIVDVNPYSVI